MPDDADLIAPILRPADRQEVARTSPLPVAMSIRHSIAHSAVAAVMLDDDRPLGVFGLVEPVMLDPSIGCPWMIGTMHLGRHRKLFLRETRRWVEEWRRTHTVLTNRWMPNTCRPSAGCAGSGSPSMTRSRLALAVRCSAVPR